jgi:hypothetical protein
VSLNDFTEKIKCFCTNTAWSEIIVIFIILLTGINAFYIGSLKKLNLNGNVELILQKGVFVLDFAEKSGKNVLSGAGNLDSESGLEKSFVASKNGTKYYPVGCSGANRIKEENKIYFSTEKEARDRGLGPSKNCF